MTQMTYAYFPGCSADSTGLSYTQSAHYINEKIGLELKEIDDWCCCGTSAAKLTSDELMHALPARSLALAEQQMPGLDVVAPCTGCYSALKSTVYWARQSDENLHELSELIEMDYLASANVKSLLEVLCDPQMVPLITNKLEKTLGGKKLACYYGCTQVRPHEVTCYENAENPTSMERLLDACGAKCVEWAFKTECCGASNHIVSPRAARKPVERIFRNAKACGAEAIVTSCPLCWLNLDMRESQINAEMGCDYHLPVYYFTELIALCMGASPDQAGLLHHFEPAIDYATSNLAPKGSEKSVASKNAKAANKHAKGVAK